MDDVIHLQGVSEVTRGNQMNILDVIGCLIRDPIPNKEKGINTPLHCRGIRLNKRPRITLRSLPPSLPPSSLAHSSYCKYIFHAVSSDVEYVLCLSYTCVCVCVLTGAVPVGCRDSHMLRVRAMTHTPALLPAMLDDVMWCDVMQDSVYAK